MAKLVSFYHVDILVDASPPVAGVVLEGPPGGPDIDYTSEDHVYINMHGFIDHESGIRLYHVALAEQCLSVDEMEKAGHAGKITVYKTVKPVIKMVFPRNGIFYSSAIAFNNAMEPSTVACSDGVTKDVTPPLLKDIILINGHVHSGLWCTGAKAWYVDKNMTLIKLIQTPACRAKCQKHEHSSYIDKLPVGYSITDKDTSNNLCSTSSVLSDEHVIYLPSNTIYLKWKTNESESQIRDYLIGIGDDKSQLDHPLLRCYESTHGKEFYHIKHSGLENTFLFYIFLKTINKAGLTSIVVLGPVVIDETPPQLINKLNSVISNNRVKLYWTSNDINDPEEVDGHFTVLYKIGKNIIHKTKFCNCITKTLKFMFWQLYYKT